jgi:microcystin degradation protein MlrC
MRVFCASLATETNTFSPLRTAFTDFAESFYAPQGSIPRPPRCAARSFRRCAAAPAPARSG